jgi:hypothetical protein
MVKKKLANITEESAQAEDKEAQMGSVRVEYGELTGANEPAPVVLRNGYFYVGDIKFTTRRKAENFVKQQTADPITN